VKVKKNEECPCDLAIVYSSGEKGIATIMTSNLDGETNLKERKDEKKDRKKKGERKKKEKKNNFLFEAS